ncbi:hypothetical protein NN561_017420 [Cricetulus griseus]
MNVSPSVQTLPPTAETSPAGQPGAPEVRTSSLNYHRSAFPVWTVATPGGTMLSMTYSESLRSVSSRCHSDWALHPVRQTDTLELQRLREVRAAAQARNMESFLRMHGLSLDGCTAQRTGMKYR